MWTGVTHVVWLGPTFSKAASGKSIIAIQTPVVHLATTNAPRERLGRLQDQQRPAEGGQRQQQLGLGLGRRHDSTARRLVSDDVYVSGCVEP